MIKFIISRNLPDSPLADVSTDGEIIKYIIYLRRNK